MSDETFRSGFVAIVGRPNVGKSTLLNRVLGSELSIVTPKAQTTRERVNGILTEKTGQLVFIDTPGLHSARPDGINACMVEEAERALEGVHLIWVLIDPSSHAQFEELVCRAVIRSGVPFLILLNKADLKISTEAHQRLEAELQPLLTEAHQSFLGFRRISGRSGLGVDELLQETWSRMPVGPMYYPDPEQLSDRPMRFFVAEKIREQLYLCLGEELPYSCAVRIKTFAESQVPIRIEAEIIVERESQKGMVIGKGGQKIKEIGTQARQTIEKLIGSKVFLGLQVQVWPSWTRESEMLKKLGYLLPEAR